MSYKLILLVIYSKAIYTMHVISFTLEFCTSPNEVEVSSVTFTRKGSKWFVNDREVPLKPLAEFTPDEHAMYIEMLESVNLPTLSELGQDHIAPKDNITPKHEAETLFCMQLQFGLGEVMDEEIHEQIYSDATTTTFFETLMLRIKANPECLDSDKVHRFTFHRYGVKYNDGAEWGMPSTGSGLSGWNVDELLDALLSGGVPVATDENAEIDIEN